MKAMHVSNVLNILCLVIILKTSNVSCDPYQILGINQHATTPEIRQAYRNLAKQWHPDKSFHPEAEKKFVEIKQAYELLNDFERRRVYDNYGISNEDSPYLQQKHNYGQYKRFSTDPIEEFIGKKFFFEHDFSFYHKLSITSKYFEQTIIPKSGTVPYIVIFYNDWCFHCSRVVGSLRKLFQTLEPLGIIFVTVNAAHEPLLVRKAGVSSFPSLVLVLDGHNYIYRENVFVSSRVVDFLRKKMPRKIYQNVDDSTLKKFLEGWMDNRVRALILEPRSQPRLRYLISAFCFRKKVAFGFVQLGNGRNLSIKEQYNIRDSLDTLLIFNENTDRPVASVSMLEIPKKTLNSFISANQFLTLPRLSSQEMLDDICPAEWNRPRKRLCVVLVSQNCEAHDFARKVLRIIALQSEYSMERVRFAYIFKEKQTNFVNSLSRGLLKDSLLRIVVIWRRDTSIIKYEWINDAFLSLEQGSYVSEGHLINSTKMKLDMTIQKLLKRSEALSYEALVENLLDEHAQDFVTKWLSKVTYMADYFFDNIEQEHVYALMSFIGTMVFMFAVGYIMVYFVKAEEETLKAQGQLTKNDGLGQTKYVPELRLHELRAEKYNGMVRLLKPGCRTIILITDLKTRPKLIPPFHKAVWPYRKTKSLLFGHMLIEKGLEWFSELLRMSLCEFKGLNINPRNCIGTVISLNGHRKCFCIYHAKHPETARGGKRMVKITNQLVNNSDPEIGTLIDDANIHGSGIDANILLEENLLDGLNDWLDRLFEGATHKYYVNYWPDFVKK